MEIKVRAAPIRAAFLFYGCGIDNEGFVIIVMFYSSTFVWRMLTL